MLQRSASHTYDIFDSLLAMEWKSSVAPKKEKSRVCKWSFIHTCYSYKVFHDGGPLQANVPQSHQDDCDYKHQTQPHELQFT